MSANMRELFHFDIDGMPALRIFSTLSDDALANITSIAFKKLPTCIWALMADAPLLEQFSKALSCTRVEKIDLSGNAFNAFDNQTQLHEPQFNVLQSLLSKCSALLYIEGFNDFTVDKQTALMGILQNIHTNHYNVVSQNTAPFLPDALTSIIAAYLWGSDKLLGSRSVIPHTIQAVYTIDNYEAAYNFAKKYFHLSYFKNTYSNTSPEALKEFTEITFREIHGWFQRFFFEAQRYSPDEDLSIDYYSDFCTVLSKCPVRTINICNLRLVTNDAAGITITNSLGSILSQCRMRTINFSNIELDDPQFAELVDVLSQCSALANIGGIDQFPMKRQEMLRAIVLNRSTNTHDFYEEHKVAAETSTRPATHAPLIFNQPALLPEKPAQHKPATPEQSPVLPPVPALRTKKGWGDLLPTRTSCPPAVEHKVALETSAPLEKSGPLIFNQQALSASSNPSSVPEKPEQSEPATPEQSPALLPVPTLSNLPNNDSNTSSTSATSATKLSATKPEEAPKTPVPVPAKKRASCAIS